MIDKTISKGLGVRSLEDIELIAKLQSSLLVLVKFIHEAPVASGVCCCGSPMEGHNDFNLGHTAVDSWDNAVAELFVLTGVQVVVSAEPRTKQPFKPFLVPSP